MPLNAHRVFFNSTDTNFLNSLTVPGRVEGSLRVARDDIRQTITAGLRNWSLLVEKRDLFESSLADIDPPALRPKFRMQGSFAYRTCNEPAQIPPQEIDLDDGLFLPIFIFERERGQPSSRSQSRIFPGN